MKLLLLIVLVLCCEDVRADECTCVTLLSNPPQSQCRNQSGEDCDPMEKRYIKWPYKVEKKQPDSNKRYACADDSISNPTVWIHGQTEDIILDRLREKGEILCILTEQDKQPSDPFTKASIITLDGKAIELNGEYKQPSEAKECECPNPPKDFTFTSPECCEKKQSQRITPRTTEVKSHRAELIENCDCSIIYASNPPQQDECCKEKQPSGITFTDMKDHATESRRAELLEKCDTAIELAEMGSSWNRAFIYCFRASLEEK